MSARSAAKSIQDIMRMHVGVDVHRNLSEKQYEPASENDPACRDS